MEIPYADQSGYGPSSAGNAPTPAERRKNAFNRFQSYRVADAMQFIDPYVRTIGTSAAQTLTGNQRPDELRRTLYSSAPGQAILDGAMALRRTGFLGQGDPIRYANNVVSGVAGGGFTGQGYDPYNRRSGFDQRVSGQGALTERVALNYSRGMLKDLYGNGSPDSSKLNGFDMTEASGVFQRIARRGGLGNAVTVKQGATVAERLEAARRGAVDPTIMAGLEDAKKKATAMGGDYGGLNDSNLSKIMGATKDPKLKKEIDSILKTDTAVFVNDDARKKISNVVKEVTKGMSALSDIYGELSAPELHAQLESLTGQRIVNETQAKRATNMVNNMTNAATSAGMDPRAFMNFVQSTQAGMQGEVANSLGLDERSNPAIKQAAANLGARNATNSVVAAKISQANEKAWTDAGHAGFAGTGQDFTQIAADTKQGQVTFMNQNKGLIAMHGARAKMSTADAAAADAIDKQIAATTDPRKLRELELRAQNLVGKNSHDGTFGTYSKSHAYTEDIRRGTEGSYADSNDAEMRRRRLADTDTKPLQNMLAGEGGVAGGDAASLAKLLVGKVGSGGMRQIMGMAKDKSLDAAGKNSAMDTFLKGMSGMSENEIKKFKGAFINGDGGLKNEDTFAKSALLTKDADWGANSMTDQNMVAQDTLDQMASGNGRDRLAGAGGEITVQSIGKALLTKKVRAIDSPENMGLAAEAMKKAGVKLTTDKLNADGTKATDEKGNFIKEDLTGQQQSGINLSDGFNADALSKLNKVAGKDIGLASKLGYGSDQELFDKTKTDKQALVRAINATKELGGVSMDGALGGMTAVSDKFSAAFKDQDWDQRLNDLGVAQDLFPTMSEGTQNTLTQSILNGETPDRGALLDPDTNTKYGVTKEKGDNRRFIHLDKGGRMNRLASQIAGAEGKDLESFEHFNKDGGMVKNLEAQAKLLKDQQAQGADTAIMKDDNGKQFTGDIAGMLKTINAAIAKLKDGGGGATNGAQVVPEMRVTRMVVEHTENTK